ncbi:hypothetical protein BDR03DRAFT_852140 [Suillus americanus]|nr:hypothetical protein BDR03DRAFT_852140 [Suillus americanus]
MDAPQTEQPEHVGSGSDVILEDRLTEQILTGIQLPVYPEEELMSDIRHQYHLDLFFKNMLDSPRAFKNFEVKEGIIRIKLNDRTVTRIPDIKVEDQRLHEIVISQLHSLLAHLGARKTLTYLRDHV